MTGKYLTVLCTFNIKCAIAEVDEKKNGSDWSFVFLRIKFDNQEVM